MLRNPKLFLGQNYSSCKYNLSIYQECIKLMKSVLDGPNTISPIQLLPSHFFQTQHLTVAHFFSRFMKDCLRSNLVLDGLVFNFEFHINGQKPIALGNSNIGFVFHKFLVIIKKTY